MNNIAEKVNESLGKKAMTLSKIPKKTLILTKKKPVEPIKKTGVFV